LPDFLAFLVFRAYEKEASGLGVLVEQTPTKDGEERGGGDKEGQGYEGYEGKQAQTIVVFVVQLVVAEEEWCS